MTYICIANKAKTIKTHIVETLFIILISISTTLSYSQINLTVKSGDMYTIYNKEMTTEVYGSIVVEEGAELFVSNTIIKTNNVEVLKRGGIHLDNSIVLWYSSSNVSGDLIKRKLPKNKQIKDVLVATGKEISIRVNGNVLHEGVYETIMHRYIVQGIYDIYLNGKLIHIMYYL